MVSFYQDLNSYYFSIIHLALWTKVLIDNIIANPGLKSGVSWNTQERGLPNKFTYPGLQSLIIPLSRTPELTPG